MKNLIAILNKQLLCKQKSKTIYQYLIHAYFIKRLSIV